MTDMQYGLEGLRLVASVAAVLLAYHYVYRRSVVAYLRQELFCVRDDLWDAMYAAGSLESVAHRRLRRHLNSLIRLAPCLDLFLFLVVPRGTSTSAADDLDNLIASEPDPAVRQELTAAHDRAIVLTANLLFGWTLPGLLVGWPLLGWFWLRNTTRWLWPRKQSRIRARLDGVARWDSGTPLAQSTRPTAAV